jgi:recombination protein U
MNYNTGRYFAGLKAKQNGQRFESMIDSLLEGYKLAGLCVIEKTPEPMRIIRPLTAGQYISCFTKAAQPDYKGTLKGGRTIVFDAKHTDSTSIYQGALTGEQAQTLEAYHRMGALAGVFVEFGSGRISFFQWAVWRSMEKLLGRKSIPEQSDIAEDFDLIIRTYAQRPL